MSSTAQLKSIPSIKINSTQLNQEKLYTLSTFLKMIPFVAIQALGISSFFYFEISLSNIMITIGSYYFLMFGITAGYHRYFSHRAYQTSRPFQFILALIGAFAAQKGPIWWAANHRHHHTHSDQAEDLHSPKRDGFWWAHCGWMLCSKYEATKSELIKDFTKYPELRWIDKYYFIPPTTYAFILLGLFGWEGLFFGFFLTISLCWHGTFFINSLAHVWGYRRYQTTDTSKNNFFLALITCGEGWHNNHHFYQSAANQGFFWWEIDFSYYVLKLLSLFKIVWKLKTPSQRIKFAHLSNKVPDAL